MGEGQAASQLEFNIDGTGRRFFFKLWRLSKCLVLRLAVPLYVVSN